MKYFKLLFPVLAVALLSSCLDDEGTEVSLPLEIPTSPALQKVTLTETLKSDAQDVIREETYLYAETHQLISHTTTQLFDEFSLTHETTLSYEDQKVTVTDAFDNVSVYTLNSQGYASSCTRHEAGSGQTREYAFSYSTNTTNGSFLTGITETIQGNVTSQIVFNSFTLSKSSLSMYQGDLSNTYDIVFNDGNASRLPLLYLTEIYPLNLHNEAMYARLLGENPLTLIHSIHPLGGTEESTYAYETDAAGHIHSCTESIQRNGQTFKRRVEYTVILQ